jgi:hypothetical protein
MTTTNGISSEATHDDQQTQLEAMVRIYGPYRFLLKY